MLSVFACAVVSTLVKYMTNKVLNGFENVNIQGAPSWYMKNVDNEICVFSYSKGDLNAIDRAEKEADIKMRKKISQLVKMAVSEHFKNVKSDDEKIFLQKALKDENLPLFIDKYINYSKIDYNKKKHTAYIRACIENKSLINYEDKRLKNLAYKLTEYRAEKGFEELDSKSGYEGIENVNGAFKELDESTK